MNVLIAGGTGFIGRHLTRELVAAGHCVYLAHRPKSKRPLPEEENVRILSFDPEQEIIAENFAADAVINLVGIIREFPSKGITFHKAHFMVTKNLADFAKKAGTRRFLQMSAMGVRPNSPSGYLQSKLNAEKYVQESGLAWTIFRPSVVFGPGDHMVAMFNSLLRKFPVIGVVGDGRYKLQPVHVDDVVAGFVRALIDGRAVGQIYEFGGPEIMTFDRMLDTIGAVIGKTPVRKIHLPVGLLKGISSALQWFPEFPISPEQIDLLLDGNFTEDNSYYRFVERRPIEFKEGVARYLTRVE
jgi:NADH dehydrogenase